MLIYFLFVLRAETVQSEKISCRRRLNLEKFDSVSQFFCAERFHHKWFCCLCHVDGSAFKPDPELRVLYEVLYLVRIIS
jgi:hypothetical protein